MADTTEAKGAIDDTLECEARNMNINDVRMVIEEVTRAARNAEKLYPSFIEGFKLDEMRDALDQVTNVLRNGNYREVARKNKWLKFKANEYLNEEDSTQGQDDRYAVVGLYKLATLTSEVIDSVCNHIDYFNRAYAVKASEFFSFHSDMEVVFDDAFLSQIGGVFYEYNYLTTKFNDARMCRDLQLSKDKPFLENFNVVTDRMNYEISNLKNLSTVLKDYLHAAPMAMNRFYILDRLTSKFADFETELKTGGDLMIATGEKLKAQLGEFSSRPDLGVGSSFFSAISDLLTKINFIFLQAQEILQRYKSSSDAPYGVMRYDSNVQKAASSQLFMSLDDPTKKGTKYTEIVKKMINRNSDLAQLVAKNAP